MRDELETLPDSVTCVLRISRLRLLYKGESRDKESIDSLFHATLVFIIVEYFSAETFEIYLPSTSN